MQEIALTQGLIALVDDEDFEELMQFKWYAKKDRERTFYAVRNAHQGGIRKTVRMHRAIVPCPTGMVIDHVNGDGLDNRRDNLRAVTHQQNAMNRRGRKNLTSGVKGVHRNGDKWRMVIKGPNGYIRGHRTSDCNEASRQYNKLAKELFGEFAFSNANEDS